MHVEVQKSGRQMEPRYVPDATAMLKELDGLCWEHMLCYYNEKLAIIYHPPLLLGASFCDMKNHKYALGLLFCHKLKFSNKCKAYAY